MVRREEERPVGEHFGPVDVRERSAQHEGSQNEPSEEAEEGPLHGENDSTLRTVERAYGDAVIAR